MANYLTSPWIGFKHFIDFFTGPKFFPLLRNTVVLGFYSVLFEFPAAILFAVCLYEVHNLFYRKLAQTISFLPHFISTVSVVAMIPRPRCGPIRERTVRFAPAFFKQPPS